MKSAGRTASSCTCSLVPFMAPSGELKTKPDPALGGRAAQHRYHARRLDPALRPRRARTAEEQDRADVRRRHRRRDLHPRCAVDLRHSQGAAPRGTRRLRGAPAEPAVPRRRLDRVERPAAAGARARRRLCESRWWASTSTCPMRTCRWPRRCAPAASSTAPRSRCAGSPPTTAKPTAGPRRCSTTCTAC